MSLGSAIYKGRESLYEEELGKVGSLQTCEANRALIIRWHNYLFAAGTQELRVSKLSSQLRKIVLHLNKDLATTNKSDIESLVALFNRQTHWSEATKADYRRCIKQFFVWYEDEDARLRQGGEEAIVLYKYLKKHLRTSYKEKSYDYSEIINDSDLLQVVEKGCRCVKERAFLSVLHEGGFRIGELLGMRIMDIEFKENCVIVKVDGKTGMRRVPLVKSMGYLARWLDEHPFRSVPDYAVWISNNSCFMHEPLRYVGAAKLVERCFSRAGLAKKCNIHWFRHSRATLNAVEMSEAIMCKYFGWTQGSKQVRRYVHCDVAQVEGVVLDINGLKPKSITRQLPAKCSCGMVNDSAARYCHKCGKAASSAVVMEDETLKVEATDEAFKLLQKIMADPELRERFERFTMQENT